MELRHLRYFVMAADEGNISRASSRLNVSQPAVSRQIRDLEEELGVQLFERRHNGLSLTDAGHVTLAHAREVLRCAMDLLEAVRPLAGCNEQKETLRVGYISTALPLFLAEGLRRFNSIHEDVSVHIFEMSPKEQEEALRDDGIDIALLGHASPALKKKYRSKAVVEAKIVAVLPDDHPLSTRKAIDLAELGEETFLTLHEKHFPERPKLMKSMFDRAGISPRVSIKANGITELLGQVGGGSGVAIVPSDVDVLPHTRVSFVKLKRPQTTFKFSAVWKKERETENIINFIREMKTI